VAVQTGPHDAQDGDDEQGGEGHIRADEGGGEERGHDVEGGRGGLGQRGEEGGDRAGEGAEHEGGEAERPDTGAGLSVGHVSLLWRVYLVRGVAPSTRPLAARGLTDSIAGEGVSGEGVSGEGVSGGGVSGGGGGVVVGKPVAQGGVAQARERCGLDLAHALTGEPELLADLLQGARGRPVESVAGDEDSSRAGVQGGEGGAHGGGQGVGLGQRVGPVNGGVGEEVAQGRGLAVAHNLVEGDGGGQGRGEGVHAGAGEARRGGEFDAGGRMAQFGVEGVGTAGEAGALHLHVIGDVGEGDLLGEGTTEGLLDPPHGVGGELVATGGVEEIDGAQEADGALLHEVVEGEAAVPVAPGEGDDEAPVGGDEGGAGRGAGAQGVLVEGPGGQVGEHARAGVGGEGGGQERIDGGGEDGRGEGQAGEEGGEDGGGGGAGVDGGGEVAAEAHGKVALGQQAGAAAGADRARQVALLGGGEHGGGGDGRRDHAGSCVVQGLYPERTRPARAPGGRMGIRGVVVWG